MSGTSYQICRHGCCDESVGPIHQSTTDDQHGCRGTRGEIKPSGAGSSRTWHPASPARVWTLLSLTSISCASPFSHGDPTQRAGNPHPPAPCPKFSLEPGSRGGAEAGECTEPSITTSARGAGCTTELLTYGCANAVLTHVVIQEQLEKRHQVNTAAPAVLPSVILAAAAWEWDGQCRDLNDSKQQLGCGAESTPDPHIPLAG